MLVKPQAPALVLSGGGVRGAYGVGVVNGIVEALGARAADEALFSVFTGTSVGAINATFLAAHAERGDLGASMLAQTWSGLRLQEHLRLQPLFGRSWPRFFRRGARSDGGRASGPAGRSLVDARPLADLIESAIPWQRLRENVASGPVHALIIAALEIASGRTATFAELAPQAQFRPSGDPRRVAVPGAITIDHVMASAAIPLLFPAQLIGGRYYCDGGLRFNTPIAPAIRVGAERLVIVSVRHGDGSVRESVPHHATPEYPSAAFLLGKLVNALLLDPVHYDLQVLQRFNRLIEVLEHTLDKPQLERVREVLVETRGVPYRRIETLVFMPSRNIGAMAAAHVETLSPSDVSGLPRRMLSTLARASGGRESDLLSYFLFDGRFAQQLIALGRRDALERADEIRLFFRRPRP